MKNKIFELFVCMLLIGTFFIVTLNTVSADQEGDYTYTVSDGKATITKYTGTGGAITIPSALGGYPTVAILGGAFVSENGQLITSLIIPDSVTTIGIQAFANCEMTAVVIPGSVTSIGDSAFQVCVHLTSLTIGKGITTIGNYMFQLCSALTSVTIPDSVTTIGQGAFSQCSSLTSITFLGLVAPTTVGTGWIYNTPAEIRGHAYSNSNFPAPGNMWNNLTMGDYIGNENKPPVAGFTWTPSTPKANQTVTFDASTSNDSDGSIIKYEWDWNNDGIYDNSYTTQTATNSWTQAGSYPVTLRVTDNSNATNTKKITVTVSSSGENGGTDNKKTPGFELILVILAITMIMFLKRKRKNSD
jgi:hypothetical protein